MHVIAPTDGNWPIERHERHIGTIKHLFANQAVRISAQGYDKLAVDDIFTRDILEGIACGATSTDNS